MRIYINIIQWLEFFFLFVIWYYNILGILFLWIFLFIIYII